MNTGVAATSWLMWTMLLWTWKYKYLFKILLSILEICPEVGLLDHVNPIFYFWGPSILFFKAEVLFYISISPPPCQHLSFSVFLDSYFILLSVSPQFPLLVSFIFSIPRSRCLGTFLCLCSTVTPSHPWPPLILFRPMALSTMLCLHLSNLYLSY